MTDMQFRRELLLIAWRCRAIAGAVRIATVRIGQARGEIRNDLPAEEIAHVFRQTVFGTLLMWSLHGDATLHERIESAFRVLWSGLAPRTAESAAEVPLG